MFHHFHPYKPFLNDDTKKIIIGTLPPPRFCNLEFKPQDVNFCYGSKDNLLWQALNKIYDLNLLFDNSTQAVNQRKEFLIKEKIGICDIVESCKREKIDASDLGMKDIELRDIFSYLKKYSTINTLIFTGGNTKNGPEYFFRQELKKRKIQFKNISNETPKINSFEFNNKVYKTISLTSPSNAANRSIGANQYFKEKRAINKDYSTFDFRVEQYKRVFKEF